MKVRVRLEGDQLLLDLLEGEEPDLGRRLGLPFHGGRRVGVALVTRAEAVMLDGVGEEAV